jgi:hypothetical protein
MDEMIKTFGMGWLPDYPDFRDYTAQQEEVAPKLKRLGQKDSVNGMLKKAGVAGPRKAKLPASVNLRPWCAPIEDQGQLGSCTANAGLWKTYRRFETLPLQGNAKPDEIGRGYRSFSPDDDERSGLVWCPSGGILAIQDNGV